MKKVFCTLTAAILFCNFLFAQTLQDVTGLGAVTTNRLFVGGIGGPNPSSGVYTYIGQNNPFGILESYNYSTSSGSVLSINPNGGFVGIGTTSPGQKLDVTGSVRSYNTGFGSVDYNTSSMAYANFGSNNHGSVLISSNLYVSGNDDLKVVNDHTTMSGAAIMIPGNSQPNQNGIIFYTKPVAGVVANSDYSMSPRMIIDASGNVGIGTTSPQSELAVKGTITSQKIKVTQTGWADFVFDSAYQLQPLSQVEKYIRQNKHLPEVSPAAIVAKEGVDLGDNQVVLLKKIEELTLYVIQQNKELQAQNKQIQDQNHRMKQMEKELIQLKTKK